DQPGTIIPQRTNPVSVAEFAPKTLNIRRKSYFGPLSNLTIHVSTSRANPESSQIIDSRTRSVRPSDSVRLSSACPPIATVDEQGGHGANAPLPGLRLRCSLTCRLEPFLGEQPHRGVGVHRLAEGEALGVFAAELVE